MKLSYIVLLFFLRETREGRNDRPTHVDVIYLDYKSGTIMTRDHKYLRTTEHGSVSERLSDIHVTIALYQCVLYWRVFLYASFLYHH